MQVLVFKTNLENPGQILHAGQLLHPIRGIHRWNVDAHDIDNVLRIEADLTLSPRIIETTLQKGGLLCEELTD